MKKNILNSILKKYCDIENTQKTGLFLLDLPTGFGKTYEVLKYVYETYQSLGDKRKIFFVTNLKKNLPHEKTLKVFFEKNNKIDNYNKDVIFINSNEACVLGDDNFENLGLLELIDEIPQEIQENKAFKRLKNDIDSYKQFNILSNKNPQLINYVGELKERIRKESEPNFRNYLRNHLYQKNKTKKGRINLIEKNESYQWVSKLYPSVLSSKKRIFFMSMDKFLVRNSPIVEGSHYFFDDANFKNSLIFIDEFDASKEVLLRRIIENQLKKRIDFVGLFEQIYSSFMALKLPKIFYTNSQKRQENIEKKISKTNVESVINSLIRQAKELNDEYKIEYSFKTYGLNNIKNFLFHDYQYNTILDAKKSYIHLEQDQGNQINNIRFLSKDDFKDSKQTITSLLNAIRRYLNYFKYSSKIIAENYQYLKNENKNPLEDKFSFDNALKSFFTELKIDNKHQEYLINSIKNLKHEYTSLSQNIEQNINDFSFYNNGIRYYDFEDNERHDTKSKVFITDFDTTPEKMLLNLAKNNFIVGISATAKIETVIGNYDLKYLRRFLQKHFYFITNEEQKYLKDIFNKNTSNYVNINTDFIYSDYPLNDLRGFGFPKNITNQIKAKFQFNEVYEQQRYIRIAKAFEQFIINNNIQSFLCFLTLHPSKNKQSCHTEVLEIIFEAIVAKYQKEILFHSEDGKFKISNAYFILTSKNFENQLHKIFNTLRDGKKLFVITTYQTLGAGQNIQYTVKDFEKKLQLGEIKEVFKRENSNIFKKDFDAIYLDKPTHLVVNLGDDRIKGQDINKRIFQAQMIRMTNKIDNKTLKYEVKETFRKGYNLSINNPKPESYRRLTETTEYHNFLVQKVIQAIGRINRTRFKNQDIYVFADKAIAPSIKSFNTSKYICLKEFEALVKTAQYEDDAIIDNSVEENINEIELKNTYVHNWIKAALSSLWTNKTAYEWQQLRELVLKFPTISEDELHNSENFSNWVDFYIPMLESNFKSATQRNHYSYTSNNDFKTIEVSFNGKGSEVSAQAVFLEKLMNLKDLKSFFESQNYATQFKENDFLISPEIFNNIYKGALGEVIGKFLIEKLIPNTKLLELPIDIFERFDYMIDDDIFIDFKFWNDEAIVSKRPEQIKKINRKIQDIKHKGYNVRKVCIINIIADNNYQPIISNNNLLIEIPFLINKKTFELNVEIFDYLYKFLNN